MPFTLKACGAAARFIGKVTLHYNATQWCLLACLE